MAWDQMEPDPARRFLVFHLCRMKARDHLRDDAPWCKGLTVDLSEVKYACAKELVCMEPLQLGRTLQAPPLRCRCLPVVSSSCVEKGSAAYLGVAGCRCLGRLQSDDWRVACQRVGSD